MKSLCQVTIPGKLMLAGEYSVLSGGRALACAVNRYMRVTLSSATSAGIHIQSDLWKDDTITLHSGQNPNSLPTYMHPAFSTVRFALQHIPAADQNCHISIQCDYPSSYGLGSSSALYLGILTAFFRAYDIDDSPLEAARNLQRSSQKYASGYDIWTQHSGGLVVFANEQVENLSSLAEPYFSVFVGGQGAASRELIPSTFEWLQKENKLAQLSLCNEQLITLATSLLAQFDEDLEQEFFAAMRTQQNIFAESPAANSYVQNLSEVPGAYQQWAAKTTGAGGEDAILVFGKAQARQPAEAKLMEWGWRSLSLCVVKSGALAS